MRVVSFVRPVLSRNRLPDFSGYDAVVLLRVLERMDEQIVGGQLGPLTRGVGFIATQDEMNSIHEYTCVAHVHTRSSSHYEPCKLQMISLLLSSSLRLLILLHAWFLAKLYYF